MSQPKVAELESEAVSRKFAGAAQDVGLAFVDVVVVVGGAVVVGAVVVVGAAVVVEAAVVVGAAVVVVTGTAASTEKSSMASFG